MVVFTFSFFSHVQFSVIAGSGGKESKSKNDEEFCFIPFLLSKRQIKRKREKIMLEQKNLLNAASENENKRERMSEITLIGIYRRF